MASFKCHIVFAVYVRVCVHVGVRACVWVRAFVREHACVCPAREIPCSSGMLDQTLMLLGDSEVASCMLCRSCFSDVLIACEVIIVADCLSPITCALKGEVSHRSLQSSAENCGCFLEVVTDVESLTYSS